MKEAPTPYAHCVSHKLKRVGRIVDVAMVFSVPKRLWFLFHYLLET